MSLYRQYKFSHVILDSIKETSYNIYALYKVENRGQSYNTMDMVLALHESQTGLDPWHLIWSTKTTKNDP